MENPQKMRRWGIASGIGALLLPILLGAHEPEPPAWVEQPPVEGGWLRAVGVLQTDHPGLSLMGAAALGRGDLAQKLEMLISDQVAEMGATAGGQDPTAIWSMKTFSRQILNGSQAEAFYMAGLPDPVHVLLRLPHEPAKTAYTGTGIGVETQTAAAETLDAAATAAWLARIDLSMNVQAQVSSLTKSFQDDSGETVSHALRAQAVILPPEFVETVGQELLAGGAMRLRVGLRREVAGDLVAALRDSAFVAAAVQHALVGTVDVHMEEKLAPASNQLKLMVRYVGPGGRLELDDQTTQTEGEDWRQQRQASLTVARRSADDRQRWYRVFAALDNPDWTARLSAAYAAGTQSP